MFNYCPDQKSFQQIVTQHWNRNKTKNGEEAKLWDKLRDLKLVIKEWQTKKIRCARKLIQKTEEELKSLLTDS